MSERRELSIDVIVRPRGENATVYSHATGLDPREIADWLDRAIIALGREREDLGRCGIHGEPDLWEDRAERDEVELAAKLHEMRRTSKGWRKDVLREALDCIAGDAEARRIIRDAAGLIKSREAASPESLSAPQKTLIPRIATDAEGR